jgi:hypothetical protein
VVGCTTGSREVPGERKPAIKNDDDDDDNNNNKVSNTGVSRSAQ